MTYINGILTLITSNSHLPKTHISLNGLTCFQTFKNIHTFLVMWWLLQPDERHKYNIIFIVHMPSCPKHEGFYFFFFGYKCHLCIMNKELVFLPLF